MMNYKISVLLHTASKDDFLASSHGIPSYYEALIENLQKQTFDSWQLVYTDLNYYNNQHFKSYHNVKHVPIHEELQYHSRKNLVAISAAKNTGIIHSQGELLITIDDAETFPPHYLQDIWDNYQQGYLTQSFHRTITNIKTGEYIIKDTRAPFFNPSVKHPDGGWCYAGTTFTREQAFKLNGFNLRMDGQKGQEDCEFGIRLENQGAKFIIDKSLYLNIIEHQNSYHLDQEIAIDNIALTQIARQFKIIRANNGPPLPPEMDLIIRETLKHKGFSPLSLEYKDKFRYWLEIPIINLELLWKKVHQC